MLSFDVSAIDIVLLVVTLVLLMLFVSQKRGQSSVEPRANMDSQEKLSRKTVKIEKPRVEEPVRKQAAEGFQECIHEFGFLKDMPKNTPVPDECFGCPKVLRCMFPNP